MRISIILIIAIFSQSCSFIKTDNSVKERIAFCKSLLDNPKSLNELVKKSVYYDSLSFAQNYEHYKYIYKHISNFINTYSNFDKFDILIANSKSTNSQNMRSQKISFYYPGIMNGIDFVFDEYDENWKLIYIYFNGFDILYETNLFYNEISQVFKEIQSNPNSFNELIEKSDLYCKYKVGNDTNYSTRFHSDHFIDPVRINFFKENCENTFSIIEVSNSWEYTRPQLWTDIELTFENSNDKIFMVVSYYDCYPCIWEMEFKENRISK